MKNKSILISLSLIIVLVAIDQITKFIIFSNYSKSITYKGIPNIFKIVLVQNTGGAWGIASGKMWLLITITIVAFGIFGYLMKDLNFKSSPMYSVCLTLIIAGTIGNFIDRIFLGYVRDFLTFDFISFPSFNFADMCMTVGVFLLIFDILFGETGKKWTKDS